MNEEMDRKTNFTENDKKPDRRKRIRNADLTEEQLMKKREYQRKWYANLSEEARIKRNEHRRLQRARQTEEERIKNNEMYRRYYANMSEDQIIKNKKNRRKRRANMTEEERIKRKEYARNRRIIVTEEQRMKYAEYTRRRRLNATEEQRKKWAEYRRKRNLNLTEEQRIKRVEYVRNRRRNMTPEQRMKYEENDRKRRLNITEEQRMKQREYSRKRRLIKSEEQRMKKKEYNRRRFLNMTEEQRIKLKEYKRKWLMSKKEREKKQAEIQKGNVNINIEQQLKGVESDRRQPHSNYPAILSGGQSIIETECNPLEKLIELMVNSNMNIKIISGLPTNLFRRILQLIGIDYTYKNLPEYHSAIRNLTCKIDICYLIELLKRWEGWLISDSSGYNVLFHYLESNFFYFKLRQDAFLLNELRNMFASESFISVSCSFKQLQTLFYHSPQKYAVFIPDKPHVSKSSESLPIYIITCPFVSTRITLPNFSMMRQNNHFDEFILLNMNNTLSVNKNKILSRKTLGNNSESYLKSNIIKFLNQLKNALLSKDSAHLTIVKKTEIKLALTIFENDIAQCPSVIVTKYNYDWDLAPYPYVRYLGRSDDGDICISTSDQTAKKTSAWNIRLQQLRQPNTSLILENFNVPYEIKNNDIHYIFDEWFFQILNTCISYSCLLCNECLGSTSPSQKISDHFSKYHGLEPDWTCTNCAKSFTNNYLINNNWKHDCK